MKLSFEFTLKTLVLYHIVWQKARAFQKINSGFLAVVAVALYLPLGGKQSATPRRATRALGCFLQNLVLARLGAVFL